MLYYLWSEITQIADLEMEIYQLDSSRPLYDQKNTEM